MALSNRALSKSVEKIQIGGKSRPSKQDSALVKLNQSPTLVHTIQHMCSHDKNTGHAPTPNTSPSEFPMKVSSEAMAEMISLTMMDPVLAEAVLCRFLIRPHT